MEFETIKQVYEAVKSGAIDESQLTIVMDNDCTRFYVGPAETEEDWDNSRVPVKEANGYWDIEKLYPLLFPKATVEWC